MEVLQDAAEGSYTSGSDLHAPHDNVLMEGDILSKQTLPSIGVLILVLCGYCSRHNIMLFTWAFSSSYLCIIL